MLKTIIVALDCSEISDCVLKTLETLQIEPKTRIILTHVLPAPGIDTELAADRPHQSPQVLYEDAQRQMQAYKVRFPESQLEIVNGDPAEEIILLANIHKADLIVIGNRGLKGVKRIIEGSVSSQVVADAPCSVFVVKAKKSEQ